MEKAVVSQPAMDEPSFIQKSVRHIIAGGSAGKVVFLCRLLASCILG